MSATIEVGGAMAPRLSTPHPVALILSRVATVICDGIHESQYHTVGGIHLMRLLPGRAPFVSVAVIEDDETGRINGRLMVQVDDGLISAWWTFEPVVPEAPTPPPVQLRGRYWITDAGRSYLERERGDLT